MFQEQAAASQREAEQSTTYTDGSFKEMRTISVLHRPLYPSITKRALTIETFSLTSTHSNGPAFLSLLDMEVSRKYESRSFTPYNLILRAPVPCTAAIYISKAVACTAYITVSRMRFARHLIRAADDRRNAERVPQTSKHGILDP